MYRSSQAIMEEVNYFRDARVRNAERYGNRNVDEARMVLLWEHDDGEGELITHELPCRYEVCPTCEGKGTHVNPSIDASGYFSDEEDDYPYEDEDGPVYPSAYEQTCGTCHGKRVVLEVDRRACELSILLAYDEHLADEASYEAERLAEIRAGC
jgi:hypothetical protein